MKFLLVFIIVLLSIKTLSFARFNWRNHNRFGAAGCILLVLLSFIIPLYALFMK